MQSAGSRKKRSGISNGNLERRKAYGSRITVDEKKRLRWFLNLRILFIKEKRRHRVVHFPAAVKMIIHRVTAKLAISAVRKRIDRSFRWTVIDFKILLVAGECRSRRVDQALRVYESGGGAMDRTLHPVERFSSHGRVAAV